MALAGCGGADCGDVLCGPCPSDVRLTVNAPGASAVTLTGGGLGGTCAETSSGVFECSASGGGATSFPLEIRAEGFEPRALTATLGPAPEGCCTCRESYERTIDLVVASGDGGLDDAGSLDAGSDDAGSLDAGSLDAGSLDAGSSDAGSSDAGSSDAGSPDAGSLDAGTCNPSAVRFLPAGGALAVGQLCDDVFVCVAGSTEAATVTAASASFTCSATPEGPCAGWTCAYRDPGGPSTLDAAELAEVCAVTLLSPTPDVVCVIYL